MKFILYIFILLNPIAIGFTAAAQTNLVPNGSFEIYDTCPYFPDQIHFATGWFQANLGTSDYFNECYDGPFLNNTGVPNNFAGNRTALNGKGYAGYYSSSTVDDLTYEREYIQCKLNSKLIQDSIYSCEFFLALSYQSSEYGVFSLGWNFSEDSLFSNNFNDYRLNKNNTHITFDTLITDTIWVKLIKQLEQNDI